MVAGLLTIAAALYVEAKVALEPVIPLRLFKDRTTGERREQTEWHRVVLWRGLADVVEKYVRKGSKVYVEGKLRTRKWEKDGIDRYTTEIQADSLTMLDRPTTGGTAPAPVPVAAAAPAPVPEPAGTAPDEVDDLPF